MNKSITRKKLTIDEVIKLAKLANLTLTEEEINKLPEQLESILEYVEKISEVNTDKMVFKSQVDLKNVFREDIAKPSLSQSLATQNRKSKSKNGYYVISTVISK